MDKTLFSISEQGNQMLYLKACPKCYGDIELVVYSDSKELNCLQCSYHVETNNGTKIIVDIETKVKKHD